MPARKFTADGPRLYDRYLTGDCEWAELEQEADLGEIYGGGYLPYSGNPSDPRHLFYRARSLRVDLDKFALTKGRRYDHRQWLRFGLERRLLSKEAFISSVGKEAIERAYQWMEPRFGEQSLARERFDYILAKPFLRHILTWWDKDELCAFALLVSGDWGVHYWYVFYRNGTASASAPGHGYLVDFLEWAKNEQLPFAYLGTSYANKSRYKSRGIGGIAFWDGIDWNDDKTELTHLRASDEGNSPIPQS